MAAYCLPSPGDTRYIPRSRSVLPQHVLQGRSWVCLLCAALAVVVAGCKRQEGVSHYRVPKEHVLAKLNGPDPNDPAQPAAAEYRMLAAMLPRGEEAWFFRLLGPAAPVAAQTESFRSLIKSVRFAAAEGNPAWDLPAGWSQQPGSGMRYATIQIDGSDAPLDLSVMKLPRNEPDLATYTLSNLNRWRGQLGLPPLGPAQLDANVEKIDLADGAATFVDLLGRKPADNMPSAPFAGGAMPPRAPAGPAVPAGPAAPRPAAGPPATSELTYEVPPGWAKAAAGGLRKAAFAVNDGPHTAEITAITLDGAGGALLPNVNRWRQQVQLGETTAEDLQRDVKKIDVGAIHGEYVELVGPEKAILGAIAQQGEQTWFFKMMGPPALVAREKPNFEAFVRSVRLTGAADPPVKP